MLGIALGSSGKDAPSARESGLWERVTSMHLLPAWGWTQGLSTVTALNDQIKIGPLFASDASVLCSVMAFSSLNCRACVCGLGTTGLL